MGKSLFLLAISSAMLAGPVLAAGSAESKASGLYQATEQYISTKLDCDNMSKFQKEICLRDADDAYKHAKQEFGH